MKTVTKAQLDSILAKLEAVILEHTQGPNPTVESERRACRAYVRAGVLTGKDQVYIAALRAELLSGLDRDY